MNYEKNAAQSLQERRAVFLFEHGGCDQEDFFRVHAKDSLLMFE